MTNSISKNISRKIKGLGIYQIAGGIIGIGLSIWLIASEGALSGIVLVLVLFAIGFFSFSIYCGSLLLKNKENGLRYSLINQYLQLINFSIGGYAFQYISGVFFSAGIDLTNSPAFKINLGVSAWQMNVNSEKEVILINLNFVAVFLIIFIGKLQKGINEEMMNGEFQ